MKFKNKYMKKDKFIDYLEMIRKGTRSIDIKMSTQHLINKINEEEYFDLDLEWILEDIETLEELKNKSNRVWSPFDQGKLYILEKLKKRLNIKVLS